MNTPMNTLDTAVLAAIKALWPKVKSKLDSNTQQLIDNLLGETAKTVLTKTAKK